MTSRPAKGYQKAAWILIVLNGAIWLLVSLVFLISGSTIFLVTGTGYPASALNDLSFASRGNANVRLVGAVFQISLGLKAFRRGERWTWFALCIIPLWGLINSYLDFLDAQPSQTLLSSFLIFAGPTTIALLLTIRDFVRRSNPPDLRPNNQSASMTLHQRILSAPAIC